MNRETKMMLAFAGLATPLGLVWFAKRYWFPDVPTFWILLGAVAVVAIIATVAYLVNEDSSARGGRP